MKKKITALCLCVAMAVVAIGGATLAYFTDQDQVKNNFTIGNIDIDLWEYAGVGTYDEEKVNDYYRFDEWGEYSDIMPGDEMIKAPVVKNTGDNDAYVRVAVVMNNLAAINNAIDETYEAKGYTADQIQEVYDKVFENWGINYSKRDQYPSGSRMWMDSRVGDGSPVLCNIDTIARINEDYYRIDCANAFMTEEEKAAENGDGIFDVNWDELDLSYYVNAAQKDERVYVFYLKLAPNEEYTLFTGLNAPADFTGDQMEMFAGLEIGIYADAIQTANFDDYTAAFNALEEAHPLGWWN